MNVRELVNALQRLPQDAEVWTRVDSTVRIASRPEHVDIYLEDSLWWEHDTESTSDDAEEVRSVVLM